MLSFIRDLRDWLRDEWRQKNYLTFSFVVLSTPLLILAFLLSLFFDPRDE